MEIKQKTSQALDHFADHSIKIMSEALAEKDKIIQTWQVKAQRLASRYEACLACGESAKLNPNLVWIPEIMRCSKCHQQRKEVAHV